jgi:ammonia channel protein AmtB
LVCVYCRDLYIYTFPLQLLLLLWILFGYSIMFDSALESGGFTSNKLSGFMVRVHHVFETAPTVVPARLRQSLLAPLCSW